MALCLVVVLGMAPSFALATYANIYGICNQYSSGVLFTNSEHSGNNCFAMPNESCDARRAYIPKCESAGDYPKHHMHLESEDGSVSWSFWKHDGKKEVQGGTAYGTKSKMTDIVGKGQWNAVIGPDGQVTLYASTDPWECPAVTKNCSSITNKAGAWQYVQTVSAPQTITLKHGVKHSYTDTTTETWGESVTVSVSSGFDAFGLASRVTVSSETSHSLAQTYTKTFEETDEQDFTDTFDAGTIFQWAWTITDLCGKSKVKGTDLVRTNGTFQPPCCLPGFAADPKDYTGKCAAMPGDKVYNLCTKELDGTIVV